MIVLITGAAGGLGRAFAIESARKGYKLILSDIDEIGLCSIAQGLVRQFGADVTLLPCDITNPMAVKEMFRYISQNQIQLDMLINVAGIDFEGGFVGSVSENISRIVDINIGATLRITHAALRHRRKGCKFYIVFVSSLAAYYPMPLKATYAASKRFLLDFSLALGAELKASGVNVLSLCPAGMPTTEVSISGIDAQGIWGDITTNRIEVVAHQTLKRVLKGKSVYIPGAVNRLLTMAGKLMPIGFICSLLYKRWHKAQRRWAVNE